MDEKRRILIKGMLTGGTLLAFGIPTVTRAVSFSQTFFSNNIDSSKENEGFDHWLIETCTDPAISSEVREQRLIEWEKAPFARFCHPREEHLLPLHVCYGIACASSSVAKVLFNDQIMGKKVTSLLWQ